MFAINEDKKEVIHSRIWDDGLKIQEITDKDNGFLAALALLLLDVNTYDYQKYSMPLFGTWKGDRIRISRPLSEYDRYEDISIRMKAQMQEIGYVRREK